MITRKGLKSQPLVNSLPDVFICFSSESSVIRPNGTFCGAGKALKLWRNAPGEKNRMKGALAGAKAVSGGSGVRNVLS